MAVDSALARENTPISQGRLLRLLKRVPQFTRMGRHFRSVVEHSTPRKLFNLARVELEFRLRREVVRGRPYILIVDPLNVCNLRCPLCPTGVKAPARHQGKMPWETFTRAIDEFAPYAYEVNLHNWGESLLHPDIFEMIAYIRDRNIATNMSTNFNVITDEKIDRLIRSGLEYLILSIDGLTQETYAQYRVRGNIDRVFQNVEKLVRRRRELGSATPYIEWQFIVFKHNAHEVEGARLKAAELGVDRFRVIPPGIPFEFEEPESLKRKWFVPSTEADQAGEAESFRDQMKSSCFYLYRSFTVNPDGGTAPCCVINGAHNDFGDLEHQRATEIWNNDKYRSARSLFRTDGAASAPTVCERCDLFAKHGKPAPRAADVLRMPRRAPVKASGPPD